MNKIVEDFLTKVTNIYATGHASEHSYRPALEELFKAATGLKVINEPKRSEYGAPDFVFLKGRTVVAYAEAKDIGVSLDQVEKSEQMERYYGYSNIILTNGLEFRFYRNGSTYAAPIRIAVKMYETLAPEPTKFQLLEDTIKDFINESKEPIKSGKVLSKVMAGKARRIRDNIKTFLAKEDDVRNENLLSVFKVIQKLLLADLDKNKFADMYAQTLVYGLFVARYYDKTGDTFSRQEARDLIPASNPFLRHFFDHIAGSSFDPRIEIIVNELCEEFNHSDVQAIVHDYYKVEKDSSRDPIIHFYEDFLQEYDSAERKKMGVFYTPLPVVDFIVRSVDEILKKEFNLSEGLADTTKIEILKLPQGKAKRVSIPVHKVQILDPATGTGTFLNETIRHIKKSFEGQEGRWGQYVKEDLLPRLHGFEIMMASYTIAHLKLSSTLRETGADIQNTRLGVYLTNSLEKGEIEEQTLFSSIGLGKAIAEESSQANKVKNELPIMVVMGNPPYSVSSQNKGEWIRDLIKEYKKGLGEKKINLDDDYIKFLRFAENLIEKNGSGIVAMITNNSFIDGITHRQMRKHLLETFDSIYIMDLHGNSKKKEKAPDGGKDENVFDIQQGVSISIFIRNQKKSGLGEVYHSELYGKRDDKFKVLNDGDLNTIKWKKLDFREPDYFFVPKDFKGDEEYEKGFYLKDLFLDWSTGIETQNDDILIKFSSADLLQLLQKLVSQKEKNFAFVNYLSIDGIKEERIIKIMHKLFDFRYTYLDSKVLGRARLPFMNHLVQPNLALVCARQYTKMEQPGAFVVNVPAAHKSFSANDKTILFPLFLYANDGSKVPNLKKEIVADVEKIVGKITPEDILDYIYAVLHSPNYREKYKEFLKIDFPRVPYPKDKQTFSKLVELGRELRELHLLESPKVNKFITTYPMDGSNKVEKVRREGGKVYINKTQYFGGVPEEAWNFYIGGYQPAQKWLKDRKDRMLANGDIGHYQKIIVALKETRRIMREIDEIK